MPFLQISRMWPAVVVVLQEEGWLDPEPLFQSERAAQRELELDSG